MNFYDFVDAEASKKEAIQKNRKLTILQSLNLVKTISKENQLDKQLENSQMVGLTMINSRINRVFLQAGILISFAFYFVHKCSYFFNKIFINSAFLLNKLF